MLVSERPIRYTLETEGRVLRVHVLAESVPAIFVECARTLAELMGGDLEQEATGPAQVVHLDAPNQDALLGVWLDELIARGEETGFVFTEIVVERLDEDGLTAIIRGRRSARRRRSLERPAGATPHIALDPRNGCSAMLVLERPR